ncbi:hypothetical protein AB0M39_11685 [Streptomyces sp. NPDC051907]|uniref:hypothetical protein n=1 Tax=Streptomyces sp. NPDC051907 TaxID=3155284 RepID=UPI0034211A3E
MRGLGDWVTRTSRGLLCASACLTLGAASHVAAGGRLPGPMPLAALFAALTVTGALLFGGRRRRLDITMLVLGGTQLALHLFLHHAAMPDAGGHAMSPMDPAHQPAGHMAGADTAGAGHEAGSTMSEAMASAHALATLGTALCVIHGERVLTRLAALVVPDVCRHRLVVLPAVAPPRIVPQAMTRDARSGVLLTRCRPRRGPPPACPA